jgi:outer membrane receptor protein involved in Fe transport
VGEESVAEIYAEALIPLAEGAPFAHSLSIELGGRYSEYDNAGSADTWKAGGEWEPVENLRFRAMWQRSVRAPDIQEAFQEEYLDNFGFVGDDPANDPCSASADPVGRGNVEKCVLQGIPLDQVGIYEATPFFPSQERYGGNPTLTPEIAETRTVGVVFTGLDSWTFSLDFFDLEVEDTIGEPVVDGICFNSQNTTNFLCDRMIRDAAAGYNVVEIDFTLLNLGVTQTKGYDAQISFATDLPSALAIFDGYADLSVDVIWTYMDTNRIQNDPILPVIECAGFFGSPCLDLRGYAINTLPQNRVTTTVAYVSGNFDMHMNWRWIEGTDNAWPIYSDLIGDPEPILAVPSVGSKGFVDLGAGYRFNDNIALRLNVSNLFDTDAAFMADNGSQNNTDPSLYDIFGRSYRMTISMRY